MTTDTMRLGAWTPKFDEICCYAEQYALNAMRTVESCRLGTRDEIRAEYDKVIATVEYVASMLSVGDVDAAVWCAEEEARSWQVFAVAHADEVDDEELSRWRLTSNLLLEIEHRARYAQRVWLEGAL